MKQFYTFLLALTVFVFLGSTQVQAQGSAQSKDYWVSYLPSIDNAAPIWLLAATNVKGTRITIHYLDDDTKEELRLEPNKPLEYRLRMQTDAASPYLMAKPDVPEVIQRRAVHITSNNPISLQGFTDADNNVGLFLILPTSNLGQYYTISAFNDQHSRMSDSGFGGWEPAAFPPTGGGFIIVGVEDKTDVTIRVTGPTAGGKKSGETWGISLNKGQTYWVRGAAESEEDDLSRSTVSATKPVAVFAGCEIMRSYDALVLQNHFDYNDYIVEQMIPEEIWGTEYISAPFTNKDGTAKDKDFGDLYRVYASEPTQLFVNGADKGTSDYWEFPNTNEVRQFVAGKPIMVVQYDYYVDFHGINPVYGRTANSEMVLVPRHNWRRNATFTVPSGYARTYFHVVAHKDSIDKIKASMNGAPANPISAMKSQEARVYSVGNYKIYTIALNVKGQCIITGPCDFAVYNYGTRDNDQIKATYGYASAAAASFGSISTAIPPRMAMDSTCTEFNLKFWNTSADARGIGEIYLLDDPAGLTYRNTPYESKNVRLTVESYGLGADSVFAKLEVVNPLIDAFGAIYVTNRAGKDTVYTFTYSGAKIAIVGATTQTMKNVLYGNQECREYTFKNTGKHPMEVTGVNLMNVLRGKPTAFIITGDVTKTLQPNETMTVTACYTPTDTMITYMDSIVIETACFKAEIAEVLGNGAVPLIWAEDWDFGVVDVGVTKTQPVEIKNLSEIMPLTLTSSILLNHPEFAIDPTEMSRFPIVLAPGTSTKVRVQYTAADEAADETVATWGRDMRTPYDVNTLKEWSKLQGAGRLAGVNFNIAAANDLIVCEGTRDLKAIIRNTGTANANITTFKVEGEDAAEFQIVAMGNYPAGYWNSPFQIAPGEEQEVTVRFTPSAPYSWDIHKATLVSINGIDTDRVEMTVDLRRPVGAVDRPTIDYGETGVNQVLTQKFQLTNTGTADFYVSELSFSDASVTVFNIIDGLTLGQTIAVGETVEVTVEATSATPGVFVNTLIASHTDDCAIVSNTHTATFDEFKVSALGTSFPATWTCQNRASEVSFTNSSNKPVLLRGVELLAGDPGAVNATEIELLDPVVGDVVGTSIVTFPGGSTEVAPKTTLTFPVRFVSAIVGPSRAPVQFTYIDTAGLTQVINVDVTGSGKNYPMDLTMSNTAPVAINDHEIEIPIQVEQTDLSLGDLYGYEFDLTFNEDMFTIADVQPGNGGLQPAAVSTTQVQVDGKNYSTVRIRAFDGVNKLQDNENIFARILMRTRLTLEDTTSITPSNLRYLTLDAQGNEIEACYVPMTESGTSFVYDPLCGDKTLREYLDKGVGFLQNASVAPNPVKHSTAISFEVLKDNASVSVEIYNALGDKVKTIVQDQTMRTGKHSYNLDVTELPSGTYYSRVSAGPDQAYVRTTQFTVSK